MTKKRFVKLLMARKICRNDANFYAWFASAMGKSYEEEIKDSWYDYFESEDKKND